MHVNIPFPGETFSVVAAILWGLSVVLFKRSGESVHPLALNAFKNIVAAALYVPTLYIAGETLFHPAPFRDVWLLAVSGAIGLAIGDTLFFQSLNMIGAGATALIGCLYSPVIILLSWLFLGERMTNVQLIGVALIVTAVLESTRKRNSTAAGAGRRLAGVVIGIGAVVAMGIGVVSAKPVLDVSPLLWAIEIRLVGGIIVLCVILAAHRRRGEILRTLRVRANRLTTVSASVLGGYVAMMFWLGGIKYTQASTAGALNQTHSIFTLIFAAAILGERITRARALAILSAFSGAMLVIFG